jgi:hypothetical protein
MEGYMKYLLLISVLLVTGCNGARAWMAGYDEDKARTLCQGITPKNDITYIRQPPPKYMATVVTPKPTEHVERAVTECIAQSKRNAEMAGVPVVFTIPLIP